MKHAFKYCRDMPPKSKLAKELGKREEFASLEQEAYLNLLRTSGELDGLFNPILREHKLSQPTYNVLRILRGEGGDGLPCLEIRRRMISPLPDITRLVDGLARAQFVRRHRSDHDRRVVYVQITKKGLTLLSKLDDAVMELHEKQLGHMSKTDLRNLIKLLEKARSVHQDGEE